MNLQEQTLEIIGQVATFLRDSPWQDEHLLKVERMVDQLEKPCVLAVAGRVKAGKSTLVNALLGENLSLTGATETTATINYFRFGVPDDSRKPVLCHWKDGRQTPESLDFVASLQGTGREELGRAALISHLEFFLPHPILRRVTLVDTPGTDALAGSEDQSHERVVSGFFSPEERDQLIREQTESTREIADGADAVLYLVGQVAHVNNESFLSEFRQSMGGRARSFNALGVMSKVDVDDELLEQRDLLASSIAEKLSEELNTVIPVSAALWSACEDLAAKPMRLREWTKGLRSIPETRLSRMLSSERSFLREYEDCPVPVEVRRQWLEPYPWRVFVLLARALQANEPVEALRELEELSGFRRLHQLLEQHFFKRAKLLRCFRVVSDLYSVLDGIRRGGLFEYRRRVRNLRRDLVDYTDFIIAHPDGKSDTANQLRRFLEHHVPEDESAALEGGAEVLIEKVEVVRDELDFINRQFMGAEILTESSGVFTAEEYAELQQVTGLSQKDLPAELCYVGQRQIFWREQQMLSTSESRRALANLAVTVYGKKLLTLTENQN